ncbi:MAG: RnfABCDGE type electron transport complex subunit B [Gammaproteobacteria bacterium]
MWLHNIKHKITKKAWSIRISKELSKKIEQLLPQYQCGRCDTPGCRDYAIEIASGKPYNRCVPGGDETLIKIIDLIKPDKKLSLDHDFGPAIPNQVAHIIEEECIGCKKCIEVCPVNAIHGAPNLMHSVIQDYCTGCELCIPPCPVDCIELLGVTEDQIQKAKKISSELYEIREEISQKARIKIKHSNEKNIEIAQEINNKIKKRNISKEDNLKLIRERLLNKKD